MRSVMEAIYPRKRGTQPRAAIQQSEMSRDKGSEAYDWHPRSWRASV